METYKLICMSFDGDHVKDSEHDTLESLYNTLEGLGSKWFFYPFAMVVKGQTVKESFGCLTDIQSGELLMNKTFAGKRLKTVIKMFKESSQEAEGMDVPEYENYLTTKYYRR